MPPFRALAKDQAFGMEYLDGLYRYALMLSKESATAEDLVQETYVRALEARDRLHADSNVKGWLFTILRNLWLNELRRQKARPREPENDTEISIVEALPGSFLDAQTLLEQEEDVSRVRSAIMQLSPESREILILREFEELSYQEIAAVLQCPTGTVMSRLGRARVKLRTLLTDVKVMASSGRSS